MDDDLKQHLEKMEGRLENGFGDRIDRLAIAFAANLSELRTELVTRFDIADRRMESMERMMAHLTLGVSQMDVKVANLNRLITGMQNDTQAVLSNQAALQRTVDDLAARVKKLEEGRAA